MKEKLSRKQKKFIEKRKAFILVTILCLGIGFALLSTNLTITGNTSVSGNSWNVYFNNVEVNEASVEASVAPTTVGTTTTSLDYTVLLDKPGDFYEFTVDAVNAGTIDAMIESINMTTLDTDVAKYLSYTATYEYGKTIAQKDVLQKNSTETYKVRVEYKTDIEANDLSEEPINLTLTFGVNYTQSDVVSEFAKLVKKNALSDSSLNFSQISSESNGRGLYLMNNTRNNSYPIYYYRGNVSNNNALFAGYCWKIVRTTETGGTKLIYNGSAKLYDEFVRLDGNSYKNVSNDTTYPFQFDSVEKSWVISGSTEDEETALTFTVETAGDYYLNYGANGNRIWDVRVKFYKDGVRIGEYSERDGGNQIVLENLTPSNVISIVYTNYDDDSEFFFNLEKGIGDYTYECTDTDDNKTQLAISPFNANNNSPAYNGYMYGTVYETAMEDSASGYVYGNAFTYSNGTYTLSDTHTGIDSTHHYTCFSSNTTCESIKYVFYNWSSSAGAYYITLTGGKSVEDAFTEMNTNINDSSIKMTIDSWFNNNFKSYFTTNDADYNDYLEDSVWCNDRSWNTLEMYSPYGQLSANNGWKPNGGDTKISLMYSGMGRMQAGTPSLTCSNKNDAFTVAESADGNGALTYPIGLLTADEINLAGGQFYSAAHSNEDFYLSTDRVWWSMSPWGISDNGGTVGLHVYSGGYVSDNFVNDFDGVRPSISLKPGVKIAPGGDGTLSHPYEFVVE